ncbi:hypothetical protein LF65_05875 [Clostridium beijerinckii]|uniref:HAMP domain-containing protein n=1 Tax=Clostridium beijerinckii TaxID=1520 RepID=A0A140DM82_CLOBE|nr:methyl-accepting chemotaxis protein [Clostridium beijerinckii]AMK50345.1 hypothetical protein LF65_05875 [Clostridium beijerinckii]
MIVAHPNKEYPIKANLANASEIGYKNIDKVYNDVISGRSGVTEATRTDGVIEIIMYEPIPNTPNWSLCISVPKSELLSKTNYLVKHMSIIILIILIILMMITYIASRIISRPLVSISEHLNIVANADFTKEIPRKFINMNDEIGTIARAVDSMQNSIKGVVKAEIEKTNSTTEEISAGMEEAAASTEEMNAASCEIKESINIMAESVNKGLNVANSISEIAQTLKGDAISSEKKAYDVLTKMDANLKSAIEESKSIHKINILTHSILEIAHQT